MKKLILLPSLVLALGFISTSCKKCQTCTTTVNQTVWGYDQSSNSSEEYCGDNYDNAPEEGTYQQSSGGVDQEVVIECEPS